MDGVGPIGVGTFCGNKSGSMLMRRIWVLSQTRPQRVMAKLGQAKQRKRSTLRRLPNSSYAKPPRPAALATATATATARQTPRKASSETDSWYNEMLVPEERKEIMLVMAREVGMLLGVGDKVLKVRHWHAAQFWEHWHFLSLMHAAFWLASTLLFFLFLAKSRWYLVLLSSQ
eukprot:scaffold95430_cov21-Tisochrysis_lutea.AAC.1